MKRFIFFLLMMVVYIATSLAEVEVGKWYRIKDVATESYMSTENYEVHYGGSAGGVKCVEYAESDNQIFTFEPDGEYWKVKSKSGYYICCQDWNVDALKDQYTLLSFEEIDGGYLIKNKKYEETQTYLAVSYVTPPSWDPTPLPAGDGYYPFCDAVAGSLFVLEKLELVPLRTITVSANNSDWGTVSGGTTDSDEITITATPNMGYEFVNWTLNDEVVSTNSTYVDMTAGDKNYVANFKPLSQIEIGKWYRIKDVATGTYMSAESYGPHPNGFAGGVKCVEYAESDNQIFIIEASDDNFKLKSKSGYYIYCQSYNVDALDAQSSPLSFEATVGGYFIKNITQKTYFSVGYVIKNNLPPAGEGYYPFCDAVAGKKEFSVFSFENVEIAPLRTITVSVNNPDWGTVSGGTTDVDEITITAMPNWGYKFMNWSVDGVVVSTNSTYVDMTAGDKHYVATFEPLLQLEAGKWYRIKDVASGTYLSAESYEAHPAGSAGGIKGVPYTEVANQIFLLEGEPENYKLKCISGYYIYCQSWNVDALEDQYTLLSFEGIAGGYRIKNMRDNTYFKVGYMRQEEWMEAPLPAGEGYYAFGDGGVDDPHNSMFVFESVDVATLRTITLSTSNPEWGSVSGETTADRAIIIHAMPNEGYKLLNWSVDGVNVGKTLTYVDYTSGDKHYVANFAIRPKFEVNVTSANSDFGMVEATQTGDVYEDEVVTFTANPRYGYRFVNWTINGKVVSTKNPYSVTITEPVELVGNFRLIPEMEHIEVGRWYRIRDLETGTYLSAENYEIHKDGPGGGVKCVEYNSNDNQIFTFEPDGEYWKVKSKSGYYIYCQKWNIDALKDDYTPLSFVSTTDDACYIKNTPKGTYFKVEYIINYYWEPIPLPAGEGYYPFGDCNPDLGMYISKFVLEGAEPAPLRTITVSANNPDWGTVSGGTTAEGDIAISATANEGYRFVNWTLNDEVVSTHSSFIDHTAGDKEYIANFEKLPEVLPIEVGKWYRIRDLHTGYYMSAENYDAHPGGEGGGVKCVEYAENPNQIFTFEPVGENYKLVTESGYYIYCQQSNVDALLYQYTPLSLEETAGGYLIKDMNDSYYFRVEYLASHVWDETPPPAGDGYYPFGDARIGDTHTATFVLEPVDLAPVRTITASVMPAEGGTITIDGTYTNSVTDKGFITLQAIENNGYKFVNWTLNDEVVSTNSTLVDMTAGNKHYVANILPYSIVGIAKTTADEANVYITTDTPATIKVGEDIYTTEDGHMTVKLVIPSTSEENVTIESVGGYVTFVEYGENVIPTEIPETVTAVALRNVNADELELPATIKKITLLSDADNNVAKVSVNSQLEQGVQVVVVKEINTPQYVEALQSTPTIFNFLSMPFAFNIADIMYWDGNSWESITLETSLRVLMYDSNLRANGNYSKTWETLKSAREIPANQGFVVVGNNKYGDIENKKLKLRFTSAPDSYNGSETSVTAYSYRKSSGETYWGDEDWNFNGVPFLTSGKFDGSYTLYSYNNESREWDASIPTDGMPTLQPYSSVMYQAGMGDLSLKQINIIPSVSNITNGADDVFARAYISIDDTNPAKIILSDESSENFVVNEDAWYMAPLVNTTAAAYFNIEGAEAKVSVQPSASELAMTVYTGVGTEHRITLSAVDGNYDVYLRDATTDEVVCLNDEDYIFTASAKTTISNRFTVSMVEPTGIIEAAKAEGTIKAVVAGDVIKLYGTEEGEQISLYTANGMVIANAVAEDGVTTIATSATGVVIIKVADEIVRVVK